MGATYLKAIPWHILDSAECERQAQYNHGQSLHKLASRGGLSPGEAMDILKGQRRRGAQMIAAAQVDEALLVKRTLNFMSDAILEEKKKAKEKVDR